MVNSFTSTLLLLATTAAASVTATVATSDIDSSYESEPVLQVDENHLYEQYFHEHLSQLHVDDEIDEYEDPDIQQCEYTLEYINALDVNAHYTTHRDIQSQTYKCDSGFALLNDLVVSVHDDEGFYFKSTDRQLLISGIHITAKESSYSNCIILKEEHEHGFFPSLNEFELDTSSAHESQQQRELLETVKEFVYESYCFPDHNHDDIDEASVQEEEEQQYCTGRSYFEIYANTWYKIVYRADCNQYEVLHCGGDDENADDASSLLESCQ